MKKALKTAVEGEVRDLESFISILFELCLPLPPEDFPDNNHVYPGMGNGCVFLVVRTIQWWFCRWEVCSRFRSSCWYGMLEVVARGGGAFGEFVFGNLSFLFAAFWVIVGARAGKF